MADRGVPQAEDTEPPAEVTPAIASGWPLVAADAEIDAPSRALEMQPEYSTGLSGSFLGPTQAKTSSDSTTGPR